MPSRAQYFSGNRYGAEGVAGKGQSCVPHLSADTVMPNTSNHAKTFGGRQTPHTRAPAATPYLPPQHYTTKTTRMQERAVSVASGEQQPAAGDQPPLPPAHCLVLLSL